MYICNNCSQLTSKKIGCDKCGHDGKQIVGNKSELAESQQPEVVVADKNGEPLKAGDWVQCVDDSENALDRGHAKVICGTKETIHSMPEEQKDPANPMIYIKGLSHLHLVLASRFVRCERPELSPLVDADVQSFG